MRIGQFSAALAGIMVLGLLAGAAAADDALVSALRSPSGGLHDGLRPRVSPQEMPWRGVGKLQGVEGRLHTACTGALVGPHTVLTAAHCMFHPRTKQPFAPHTLHFLLGFEFEGYAGHAVVVSFVIGAGFQLRDTVGTRGADWVLLMLDRDSAGRDLIPPTRAIPPV